MNVDDFLKHDLSRRQFLGRSAQNAAGVAAGFVSLGQLPAHASANEQVNVAVIGVRGQGKQYAVELAQMQNVAVKTICDVDERVVPSVLADISAIQREPAGIERDFRNILDDDSVDAVVISTPDHWHGIMTIMACQAGKDIFLDSPVSHAVEEGRRMIEAVDHHQRVVQVATQQRSGSHFQSAIDYVQSGKLGNVHLAKAWTVHRRKPIGVKKDSHTPSGVDYEMWLGPAPQRPFNPNRFHRNWQCFWDYGSGELGHWGVHMLDIARWGLNVELPKSVASSGGTYHSQDDQQTPDTQIVTFNYPTKTIVWEHRLWSTHGIEGRSAATAFYGDRGTLIVDRGGWKVYGGDSESTSGSGELTASHLTNFVDCVRSRQQPVSTIESGHLSSTLCHLGNISYRLRRQIDLNSQATEFVGDDEANDLLSCQYRDQWQLPAIS